MRCGVTKVDIVLDSVGYPPGSPIRILRVESDSRRNPDFWVRFLKTNAEVALDKRYIYFSNDEESELIGLLFE